METGGADAIVVFRIELENYSLFLVAVMISLRFQYTLVLNGSGTLWPTEYRALQKIKIL